MKKGRRVGLFLFIFILLNVQNVSAKDIHGRVLFISSYDYSFNTVPSQIKGIEEALDEEVLLNYEFMDTKNVNSEEGIRHFHDMLAYKLTMIEPYDVIIVGDDAALQFVLDYRQELFAGIPIVFEAVNDLERAQTAVSDGLITGVMEKVPYEDNLELATSLYPNATRIAAIVDNSISGIGAVKEFQTISEKYPQYQFEEINASEYSKKEFTGKLEELDADTIVIFLICSEDKYGNSYTNREVESLIREHANVPIFRVVQEGVGNGFFGGAVVSFEDSGRIAGEMAMRILWGTAPSEISMVKDSPNIYLFDENVVQHFNIMKKQLPKDSEYVNRKVSFLERNAQVIVGIMALALILILMFGIIVVSYHLEEKNKASQAKTIFLSRISHEIRTPMNAILGITSLTKQCTKEPDKVHENLDKIESASKLLLNILNDVLDMSAIENGKMKISKEAFGLETVLAPTIEMYDALCRQKGIEYNVEFTKEITRTLLGDSLRLSQIMNNLLSNAVKFTEPGGRITLTISPKESIEGTVFVQFEVEDTGCGMSEDMKKRIFKPFEQESSKTALSHGGSGLGMAITKNLTELMNGTISVESEKGKGTKFQVQLPFEVSEDDNCKTDPDKSDTRSKEDKEEVYNLTGMRVLLADDTELNLDVARELLELAGVQVECARNGQETVEKFKESAPGTYDVILMDVQMPVLDGYQATKKIRSLERADASKIPILAMTANAFTEDIEASENAGMTDHISKPIDTFLMYEKLERYFHGKSV